MGNSYIGFTAPVCFFFDEGAVALAEVLAESRHIQRLDLRQNPVKLGGLMALSLALRINRSLAQLDVDPMPPEEQVAWCCKSTWLQSKVFTAETNYKP